MRTEDDDLEDTTRIILETEHDDPDSVALAISPDNTKEMSTKVERGKIITTVQRDGLSSAGATADDYARNLIVADEILSEKGISTDA